MNQSSVSDEKLTETWLTKMDRNRAIIILSISSICTIFFLFISFLPKSTIIKTGHSSQSVSPVSTSYIRTQFDDFNYLSPIALFRIEPKFIPAVVDRNDVTMKIKGKIILLNDKLIQTSELSLDQSISYNIEKKFDGYMNSETFLPIDVINFSSMFLYLDVSTSNDIILDIAITSISTNNILSILGIVTISILAISNAILLITLIVKRVPPIEKDQWGILILSGILFLVDGPWLLSQFYTIHDIMPQLFHGAFIVFAFIFLSVRSRETPKRIFNSKSILISLFLMNVVIIILELTETKLKPLIGFAYYKKLKINAVFIILFLIFCVYHISIIFSFIYGFYISRFERKSSFFLTLFMFFILEITQITTFLIRLFVNEKFIGLSFAADIFYINEANLFCFVLLYLNTPLSLSDDNIKPLMDQD